MLAAGDNSGDYEQDRNFLEASSEGETEHEADFSVLCEAGRILNWPLRFPSPGYSVKHRLRHCREGAVQLVFTSQVS